VLSRIRGTRRQARPVFAVFYRTRLASGKQTCSRSHHDVEFATIEEIALARPYFWPSLAQPE
jgi:hypothetical protein